MTWTHFWDMHSGGRQKLKWAHIFIEAPELEAKAIFWHRFKRNPERVTCTCCGDDYSISSDATLEAATAFERNLRSIHRVGTEGRGEGNHRYIEPHESIPEGWEPGDSWRSNRRYSIVLHRETAENGLTLDELRKEPGFLFIEAKDISPDECREQPPREGYVWAGDNE